MKSTKKALGMLLSPSRGHPELAVAGYSWIPASCRKNQVGGESFSLTGGLQVSMEHILGREEIDREAIKGSVVEVPLLLYPLHSLHTGGSGTFWLSPGRVLRKHYKTKRGTALGSPDGLCLPMVS